VTPPEVAGEVMGREAMGRGAIGAIASSRNGIRTTVGVLIHALAANDSVHQITPGGELNSTESLKDRLMS
jgi:hypothetical protein